MVFLIKYHDDKERLTASREQKNKYAKKAVHMLSLQRNCHARQQMVAIKITQTFRDIE